MGTSSHTNNYIPLFGKIVSILTHEVTILLFLGIIVGLILADDYGLSWDEYYNETYARHTIEMYLGKRAPGDTVIDKKFYGPSYLVPWLITRDILIRIVPGFSRADAGHLVYWLSFLPAPLLLYGLCRRYSGRIASLGAVLLFATQPLIFGHAFVNPKDPPFMTQFLASVFLGLLAVDLSAQGERWLSLYKVPSEAARLTRNLNIAWQKPAGWRKLSVLILWAASVLTSILLLLTERPLGWALALVERAYAGQAFAPVQTLFNLVAQDAYKTSLTIYLEKARDFYLVFRFPILILGIGLIILISMRLLKLRGTWSWFSRTRVWWAWIFAAVILGLCTANRIFGPFAGALVALYAIVRLKKRAWLPIAVYVLVSILVLFASWPSLWTSPVKLLYESVFRMSRFPWEGRILYDGVVYAVEDLPWHYVPRLIALQLTIPVLLLSLLGLIVLLIGVVKRRQMTSEQALPLIWFGLPMTLVVLLDVQIYSAFRHLMFTLPALFIISSIGIESILKLTAKSFWTPLMIGIAILPGFIGIIRLHPYELIYYNELTGGVSGAVGRYVLDDWGMTFRDVIEYINEVAPQGAEVRINSREYHTMTPFAREDLKLSTLSQSALESPSSNTYFVNAGDLSEYFQAVTVYVVEREGVRLATVQYLP